MCIKKAIHKKNRIKVNIRLFTCVALLRYKNNIELVSWSNEFLGIFNVFIAIFMCVLKC